MNQDYSRLHTHTVKFTKLANMITLQEIVYRTEPEISNSIHKTACENR